MFQKRKDWWRGKFDLDEIDGLPEQKEENERFSKIIETIKGLNFVESEYDLAGFPAVHDALRTHFDEKQFVEIDALVINMNLWTRLKLAQGATPVERI